MLALKWRRLVKIIIIKSEEIIWRQNKNYFKKLEELYQIIDQMLAKYWRERILLTLNNNQFMINI